MDTVYLYDCSEISGSIYCPPSLSHALILVCGAIFVLGLAFIFFILKRQGKGFGAETNRALGIVLFLPVLFFAIGFKEFSSDAIAALLGTLAGYVFSASTRKDE